MVQNRLFTQKVGFQNRGSGGIDLRLRLQRWPAPGLRQRQHQFWIRQGWGIERAIERAAHSHHSCNRGVWAETVKLIIWDGHCHNNVADGIDFDAGTSRSVAYANNVCNNNSR